LISDYIKDTVDIVGLSSFHEGEPLTIVVHKAKDGKEIKLKVNHTFNAAQIDWFKHGSALNLMAEQSKQEKKPSSSSGGGAQQQKKKKMHA